MDLKALEVGSGNRKGFSIGIDIDKRSNADIICDVNQGIPLKDNTFTKIYMRSILEHVDAFNLMKEVYRISKKNAIVEIWTPHFSSHQVWTHLQHKRGGSYFTFISHKPEEYGFEFKPIEVKILIEGREYPYTENKTRWHPIMMFIEKLANRSPLLFERFWCYWVGGAEAIYYKLKVNK